MRKEKTFWFHLLIMAVIFVLSISLINNWFQNDLFYDIKIGDYILKHEIDLKDHFAFLPLSYTYPHWLFDIIVAFIYRLFSFRGIHILVIILFASILFIVYRLLNKMNDNNKIVSFVLLFLVANLSRNMIAARSQLFSFILFLFQIYLLESFVKTKKTKYLYFLPVLSFLLANIHGTIWPFQFILYLPYIIEHIAYLLRNKKINIKVYSNKISLEDASHYKKIYFFIFLSFITGLFTPSFGIAATYFIKIMSTNTIHYIGEHQPTVLANTLPYLFCILFILILFIFTKTKLKLRDFLMISGLLFTSLFSIRHISLFAILGILFFGRYLSSVLKEESTSTCEILYSYFQKPFFVLPIVCICFVVCFINFQKTFNTKYYTNEYYPIAATKYIKENLDVENIRLFHSYNVGSYLLFHDIPVWIDSRSDLYTEQFNRGVTIFDDFTKSYYDLEYEEVFRKYNFTHLLVEKKEHIYKLLEKEQLYKIIYQDNDFVLFEVLKN